MGSAVKKRNGYTLVELMASVAGASVIALTTGVLLVGGHNAWQKTFDSATSRLKTDAHAAEYRFCSIGTVSNCLYSFIYDEKDGTPSDSGNAVEFGYWADWDWNDDSLTSGQIAEFIDVTRPCTHYAQFYVDSDSHTLRVDYGYFDYENGGMRVHERTEMLAQNILSGDDPVFSRTQGSTGVRMNLSLEDDSTGESIDIRTAVLMRNMWPR